MGSRIVVMSMGYVQQIDTPQNLYNYPENKFVAGFIGTPQMNFFSASLKREKDIVKVSFDNTDNVLEIPFQNMLKVRPEYLNGDKKVIVGLRCEHISADPEVIAKSSNIVKVKISHFEELGNETLIYGDLNMDGDGLVDTTTRVIVKQYGGTHTSKIGDIIDVAFDMEKAHFFDGQTEKTIAPRIPEENVFDVEVDGDKLTLLGKKINLPKAVADQIGGAKGNATLIIPTDALRDGNDITATVVEVETIKNVRITHLQIGNRTFFMIGGKEHSVGDEISLGIDFKRITIEGDINVSPLPAYDTFYGSYFDRANAKRSVSYLIKHYAELEKKEIIELNKQKFDELSKFMLTSAYLDAIKEEYAAKRKEILGNESYRLGTESLGKEGKKKVKAEADLALAVAKQDYEAKVNDYNAKKAAFNNLSDAEKAARQNKEQELNAHYQQLINAVKAKYAAITKQINDNLANVEAALLPIEQQNEAVAKAKIAEINANYAKITADKQAELTSAIEQAKANVATKNGPEKDTAVVALKEAKRAKIDGMEAVKNKHNEEVDEVMFQSKVFTMYINGQSFVTSQDINKKIIKGLGAQLFLSHYRIEAPHNAYTISEQGIALTVNDIIDYGTYKYAKCDLYGDTVYVEIDKAVEIGSTIHISIDIDKARVFENMFDIRLY